MNLTMSEDRSQQAFSNTNKVIEQLGTAIVCGDYAEGTMIPLDPDLEEMFGVSRTVVREAKKTLVGKGLLQSKAKVGTRVRQSVEWSMFDPDVLRWHAASKTPEVFLKELFEIRLIFEPAAAGFVAGNASEETLSSLSDFYAQMEQARNPAGFAAANIDFHKTILQMSGNRFLSSLGDMVQAALCSIYLRNIEPNGENGSSGHGPFVDTESYVSLVKAIKAGRVRNAEKVMQKIIEEARDAV